MTRTVPLQLCAALTAALLMAGCGAGHRATGPKEDATLRRFNLAARGAFDRGDIEGAALWYGRALRRAQSANDSGQIADATYNLAACALDLGNAAEATALLHDAEVELKQLGRSDADALLLEAEAQRRTHDLTGATDLAARVLHPKGKAATPTNAQRADAELLLARVACDRGHHAEAEAALHEAESAAGRAPPPALAARLDHVSGRVAVLAGNPVQAAQAFEAEAMHLRRAGIDRDIPEALEAAGNADNKAGNPGAAADAYYRAARTALGQNDRPRATRLAEAATVAANNAHDETIKGRIATLLSTQPDGPATRPRN